MHKMGGKHNNLKQRVNSASRVRYAQTRHHGADHLHACKDYLRL